jgi:hypothetical protein
MELLEAQCRLPCLGRLSVEMDWGSATLAVPLKEVERYLPPEAQYPQLHPYGHLPEAILR